MAEYPSEIYVPREKENKSGVVYDPTKKTVMYVEDLQALDDEVVAIETELGENPKGEHADVAAYLAWLESQIGGGGGTPHPALLYEIQSASYGGSPYAITMDDTYVYISGTTTYTIRKYLKSDLSFVAESPSYGAAMSALAQSGDYVYGAGGGVNRIYKFLKSDMSKVAESDQYGGAVQAMAISGNYIYIAGATVKTVKKFLLSDLSYIGATPDYGGTINSILIDDTYIYAGGATTQRIRAYLLSDLSYAAQSDDFGGEIKVICKNTTHLFAVGEAALSSKQYLISDLSFVKAFARPKSTVWAMGCDETYLYVGSYSDNCIRMHRISDATLVSTSMPASGYPRCMYVEGSYVYWCDDSAYVIHKTKIGSIMIQ